MEVQFPKLNLTFTVNSTAFSIGNFEIKWYGILIAVGFLLALLYVTHMAPKMNIDSNRLFDAIIVGLLGGVVCARLYFVIFSSDPTYWENPLKILDIHSGGVGIYGGLIGGLALGGIVAKLRKLSVFACLDVASLGFLIGQCIGRWGNFINQEAFGTATDLPWGMYSANTAAEVVGNVHPCFLYESILCLIGFILLHFFNKKLRRYDGQTFLLYIIWYGVCRFFIEGLRTDSLLVPYLDIRVSQLVAAISVIASIILLLVFHRRTKLTGCGSRKVMEAVGLAEPEVEPEDDGISTIFGDLPPEEDGAESTTEEKKDDLADVEKQTESESPEEAEDELAKVQEEPEEESAEISEESENKE